MARGTSASFRLTFCSLVYPLLKHLLNATSRTTSRISIILWGLAEGVKEEDGSPPLLGSDGQGPHAQRRNGTHGKHHGDRRR